MWRPLLAALLIVAVGLVWATGLVAYRHHTGYFAPVFAADGRSVYAIERSASGVTVGFGYQFWSAPATVFMRRDRHTLINVALDGTVSRLAELPLSPLTGARLSAYHGSILGSATAHLRREQEGLGVRNVGDTARCAAVAHLHPARPMGVRVGPAGRRAALAGSTDVDGRARGCATVRAARSNRRPR